MHDDQIAAALVERLVAAARIPSRASRDDLRRELRAHFDDAAASAGGAAAALRRFGDEAAVGDALRRVYRRDYLLAYLAKTAASTGASLAAALLIQLLVNLRMPDDDLWRLAPGFSHTAGLSIAIALAVVTAWEILRAPFSGPRASAAIAAYLVVWIVVQRLVPESASAFATAAVLVALACGCSTLDVRPAKLLITFAAFAAAEYLLHAKISVPFGPVRALLAGAIQIPVWASTLVILARVDRAFSHIFETAHR
jgi:hypothetical protein